MAIASDIVKKKKKTTERKTVYSSGTDDIEVLKNLAQEKGYKLKEKKPSLFKRTIDVISRPLYASANLAKDIVNKGKFTPLQSLKKGITGEEKTTYSDVLSEMGVKNKWVKGGVGFALDVALDPTTYFGGSLIKGASKVVGKGLTKVGNAYSKVAPESAEAFAQAGKKLKEGVSGAFSIYGGGRSKKLVDDAFVQLNKLRQAKENVIDDIVYRFGKNVDDKKLERAGEYVYNNRLIERGLKKGEIKYPQDPQTRELVTAIKKLGKELGQEAGLKEKAVSEIGKKVKGTMDEWYFPGLDEMRLKPTGKESKIFGVGKEGYKKEFKGLIEEGRRVKDVREAFGRRFFEVTRDKMNRQFLGDIVEQYGSKVAKEGMIEIKDKIFGKSVGFLKEADAKFINNILFPEMKSIDLLAKGIGYDAFTNLFKTAVTAYFPAFHIRNYLSGMVQNYQVLGARALAPANINTGLAILKKSNKVLNFKNFKGTAKELGEAMDTRFGSSSRYISDIGDYIDELANNKFKVKKISKARQVGAFVEMNQKANAVATALRKGHTVDEALDLAEKAGFDYTKITPFESKVMKRLIPFYTFARKNAQLQAETFVKHPERIINQSKLANAFSNMFGGKTTEEDIKGLPNWAVEGLGFKIKEGKYLTKFGLPLEEFIQRLNKPMMSTLSSLNPIIKYPVESKLGYDFFREQKITDVNKIAPASGEMLLKAKENGLMPEWLDNALNINKYEYKGKTYYNASPKALHLLRNIPTARLENTLEKIFNKDMGKVDKYMAFFSGGKIYDIDIEMQKYFQERDLKRDIEDYLLGKGVGSKFETFNIYKNEQ
jgi:YHS domain-containing protein